MNKTKHPTHATIVIRLNGDETTLAYLPDEPGQITRHTFAKRNPKDEYDAYIGSRVALDRLFCKYSDSLFEKNEYKAPEKTQATKKSAGPAPKLQIGDIVRVTKAHLSFGSYETGDVAVVADIITPVLNEWPIGYKIVVRSKERKGNDGVAFERELTLLHRPAKEGEKR